MKPCPDDGRLRAALDDDAPDRAVETSTSAGELADASHVREHVDTCPACSARVAALHRDALVAAKAVHLLASTSARDGQDGPDNEAEAARVSDGGSDVVEPPVDVEAARKRVRATLDRSSPGRPWWQVAAGVVGVMVLALSLAMSDVRQAVADALSVFRAERLQVVTFDPDAMRQDLMALSELGQLRGQPGDPVEVDGLDEAADIAGFEPGTPAQPPSGTRRVMASAPHTVELEFGREHVADLPAELDGAVLEIAVPGTVVQHWDTTGSAAEAAGEGPLPGAVVAEAGQVRIDMRGADLADLRAWVLSRPDLSPGLVEQLENIDDWRTTLPLPLPTDGVVWHDVRVGDHDGKRFGDESGLAAAVVWQADGRLRAAGGMMSSSDAQALAEDLDASS